MKRIFINYVVALLLVIVTGRAAGQEVRNVIFLIGDGMGLAHMQAAKMSSGEPLQMERAQYIGLAATHSANNRVTDSAAAGTALSTGVKTHNGMVGVAPDGTPLQNIREKAQAKGMATGVVVTKDVTDATPATFLVHSQSRKLAEDIAVDIVGSGVDVLFGGGRAVFAARKDERDLVSELNAKGYRVITKKEDIPTVESGKVVGLFAKKHMNKATEGRGDYLAAATRQAITILERKTPAKGFFLMVEGSQIDSGGHANDSGYVVGETLDFDRAVGVAFDYADTHPGTLVIVTADHETGGMTLPSGNEDFTLGDQGVEIKFSTGGHSGVMVPVYAYGVGAQRFSTFMDNTDIPKKIAELLGF